MSAHAGWVVSVETEGPEGWGWYYLDNNGDPLAEDWSHAHTWPDRQAALQQAEKWHQARVEPRKMDPWP